MSEPSDEQNHCSSRRKFRLRLGQRDACDRAQFSVDLQQQFDILLDRNREGIDLVRRGPLRGHRLLGRQPNIVLLDPRGGARNLDRARGRRFDRPAAQSRWRRIPRRRRQSRGRPCQRIPRQSHCRLFHFSSTARDCVAPRCAHRHNLPRAVQQRSTPSGQCVSWRDSNLPRTRPCGAGAPARERPAAEKIWGDVFPTTRTSGSCCLYERNLFARG